MLVLSKSPAMAVCPCATRLLGSAREHTRLDPSMSCRPARMREASRCWGRPAPKGCVLHLRAVSGLRPPRLSTFEAAPVLHFVRRRAAGRQLTDATLLSPSGPVAAPALATHGGSCSRALQRPGIRLEFCPPLPPPLALCSASVYCYRRACCAAARCNSTALVTLAATSASHSRPTCACPMHHTAPHVMPSMRRLPAVRHSRQTLTPLQTCTHTQPNIAHTGSVA